jgi:hypothetical protein
MASRDDTRCECVGLYGPNPECGKCSGSGCYTGEAPGPYPVDFPELAGDVKGYPPLRFTYKNWRGEVRVREATPCGAPWFGTTEWHPAPQWLLPMIDAEDGKRKDFALNGMAMYGDVVGVPGVV